MNTEQSIGLALLLVILAFAVSIMGGCDDTKARYVEPEIIGNPNWEAKP